LNRSSAEVFSDHHPLVDERKERGEGERERERERDGKRDFRRNVGGDAEW